MKKLINLLLGYVEIAVTGAFPERLLNLCAQNRLPFWRLRWTDETSFTFRVALRDRKRLDELARRAMCDLEERSRRGAAVAAERMVEHRWGFLLGLGFCVLAVSFLSRFLLVIEVTGNERVPTAVILSQLQRAGVRPGAFGPAIREREAANTALLGLPELSYLAVNIYGTRAEIIVREVEKAPELLKEDVPADVVAAADGIIEDIQTDSGRAMFRDGDVVAKGETLISGVLDLKEPEGGTVDLGSLVVHAAGSVTARTWRTLEETIPLTGQGKEYTGEEARSYHIKILWLELDFFENSSISGGRYDKITETADLTLFGRPMPASLTTVTRRGYILREEPVDTEAAAGELKELLLFRLEELMEERKGEALRTDFVTRQENGRLTVTLLAECREEIGRTVERDGEVGRVYGGSATTPPEDTKDNG